MLPSLLLRLLDPLIIRIPEHSGIFLPFKCVVSTANARQVHQTVVVVAFSFPFFFYSIPLKKDAIKFCACCASNVATFALILSGQGSS
jgi:hypothetical protein